MTSYPGPPDYQYAPPPGPPPSHDAQGSQSQASSSQGQFAPPPGPPPSLGEPPPYHDWTIIPDTSTLPPPPTTGHEQPASNNADSMEADRAHAWCAAHPLLYPHQPTSEQHSVVQNGQVQLSKPHGYGGELKTITAGSGKGFTWSNKSDGCLLTSLPLYFAFMDSPVRTGRSKVTYFEVEILSIGDESTLALGFCAIPYPTWRLPGWERASLGVHSDNGHRYVNDPWGGKDFTQPFKSGDTVGIGMSFSVPETPLDNIQPAQPLLQNKVEVMFTRNGRKENSWDIHEELDHETDQGIDGLDGLFDLYGAIGVFGVVSFAAKFKREEWLWRPH
ncbi:uncharacterized protein KY384_001577 [Bacidia gigantensis]|uniref:uncharacterized protein n=1 Tax=Bacidia gigantensis TaxID=2732470 RepID=UPI001D03B68F|nr:uncharacterized protein KY384_001577 [Bacidia gigantensis]KAG8533836.1 hypothetical protein KY384_001577 [Bacidia gigantensis]